MFGFLLSSRRTMLNVAAHLRVFLKTEKVEMLNCEKKGVRIADLWNKIMQSQSVRSSQAINSLHFEKYDIYVSMIYLQMN